MTPALSYLDAAMSRVEANQHRSTLDAYEARCAEADRAAAAEAALSDAFMALIEGGKLDAVAPFADPLQDRSKPKVDGVRPTRPATLFDVLTEACGYGDFDRRVMGLVVRCANNGDAEAKALIRDVVKLYAEMNAD